MQLQKNPEKISSNKSDKMTDSEVEIEIQRLRHELLQVNVDFLDEVSGLFEEERRELNSKLAKFRNK